MLRDPIGFLEQRYRAHGEVFRSCFGIPVVFLVGPEANKHLMLSGREQYSHQQGYQQSAFGRVFAGSLALEDGEQHQHDRDILQPAMGRMALAENLEAIQSIWERAADSLAAGRTREIYSFVRDATFEVAAKALLNLELGNELDRSKSLFERLIAGAMAPLPLRIPFGRIDRGLRAREELIRLLVPRIEEARTRPPQGMLGALAHYQADGAPLHSRRIAEHLLLLFWAGYDTTASTGSWMLFELARASQWQEQLREEEVRVLGSRRMSMAESESLPAHALVLKEVERLRPATLFHPRRTTAEVEVCGKPIPAGTMVFYSPYLSHRIEAIFPRPEVFDPSRWSGQKPAPSTALVGFGGGPRICLGKAFALLQLRVMLTSLLRRYRLEVAAPGVTVPLPTHRLKDAQVRFEPLA